MDKEQSSKLPRSTLRSRRIAQATPQWSDREQIKLIYSLARQVEKATGVPHHVDHHFPICGKTVSGLHVPANLQVIPALLNMRKGCSVPKSVRRRKSQ